MSEAEFSSKDEIRLVLINNERRKLLAGALDRLSTAFIAVGVLGQVLSLGPSSASLNSATIMLGWIFWRSHTTLDGTARPWRTEGMSSQEFFWYVFPWIVSAFGGAWLVYDYYKNPHHR